MIMTTAMLLEKLKEYGDPFGKIRRLCREGRLFKLTKELYETDGDKSGYLFAPVLYGPSYLSFDYALSYHGLIPEAVHEYTSATCGKGKKKFYSNHFGDYSYRDVPTAVFPLETTLTEESGYPYFLATPEKALCDKLYTLPPAANQSELRELLLSDLRIDKRSLLNLQLQVMDALAEIYKCKNVRTLAGVLRRMQ